MGLTGSGLVYNHNVMERLGYTSHSQDLDAVFAALADPTRRAILTRLAAGEASVNEIAAPFEMSQPAVSKHLRVLERAGLIERDVDKQRRPARLKAEPMAAAVSWLEEFKQFWSSSFNQLDGLLEELKKAETKRRKK
jgi:DNA-binding transcriptional ArsR family regulator